MNGKKIFWRCLSAVVITAVVLAVLGIFIYMTLVTKLPTERPEQFSFEIYEGGGMNNESFSYDLHNGRMIYSKQYESSELTAEFDLTEEELDYIWQILRVERFDHIREHSEGDVYDRGGTSLRLNYGDENIDVADSGSSFVRGDSAKRFYAIADAVIALSQPYIIEQKKALTIRISEDLLSKVKYLQLNDQIVYEAGANEVLPIHVSVLPGDYVLAVATVLPPPIYSDYQRFTVTVTDTTIVFINGPQDAMTVTHEPILIDPTNE